jgi:hypothetical protein
LLLPRRDRDERGPARSATSHCWWRLRSSLILGICEVTKDAKAGWSGFLKLLNERVLKGARLIVGRLHGACRERRRVDSRARALSVPSPTANWRWPRPGCATSPAVNGQGRLSEELLKDQPINAITA